jgi:preprotein translocase subunit SecG
MVFQTIIAIALIIVVLMQPSKSNGLSGLVAGGSSTDSFYSKNKGRTSEAMLIKLTAVLSAIFAGLCIAQNLIK